LSQDPAFRRRMVDLFSDKTNRVTFPSVQDLGREVRDLRRRVSDLESRLGSAVTEQVSGSVLHRRYHQGESLRLLLVERRPSPLAPRFLGRQAYPEPHV
jgi:hypothetical protein